MCTDARSRSRGGAHRNNRGIAGSGREARRGGTQILCMSVVGARLQDTIDAVRAAWVEPPVGWGLLGTWRGDTTAGLFSDGRSGASSTRFRGRLPGCCAACAIRTLAGSAFLPASCWFSEASSRSCRSSESGCCPSGSCSSRTTSRSCGSRSGGLRSGAYGNGVAASANQSPLMPALRSLAHRRQGAAEVFRPISPDQEPRAGTGTGRAAPRSRPSQRTAAPADVAGRPARAAACC
jgi:hypothetical protein